MTQLTTEQVFNSYEFELAVRLLKKRFPWITSVKLDDTDDINRYGLIFLNVGVDIKKFIEENPEASLHPWSLRKLLIPNSEKYNFINLIFNGIENTFDGEIDRILAKLHQSPALPDELRLPTDRRLAPSMYSVYVEEQDPEYIKQLKTSYLTNKKTY